MSTGEIISLCALCLSAIVGLFAILTFARNGNKDNRQETKESVSAAERRGYEKGELSAKLDAISNGIDSIKADVKAVNTDVKGVREDVGTLENNVTSLKSRVITLEREMHEVKLKLGIVTTEYKGS